MRHLTVPLILVLLAGCAPADAPDRVLPEDADMAASVRRAGAWATGGCGDVTLFGHDPRDERAFFVGLNGMATAAQRAPIHRRVRLPSADVSITMETGERLTSATCVGAFPLPGPSVRASWEAIAGQVQFDVVSTGTSPAADASVMARNVVFEDGSGRQFTLPYLRVRATSVGFYPP